MKFKVERNDIAKAEVDAVVLPANWRLRIGTGASMALFEAAGKEQLEAECAIQSEMAKERGIRLVPGVCVPTHAFDLPAKVILHAIVPKWRPKEERKCYEELCESYASALVMADEMGMESIAFPLLAAGNNGFDTDIAIDIALQSLGQYEPQNNLAQAYLITFDTDVTKKIRDRGIEVEERIDRLHVLDQGMHQSKWWHEEQERRKQKKEKDKPAVQAAIDKGVEWIQEPKNLLIVAELALQFAGIALSNDGVMVKAQNALKMAKPLIKGDQK